MATASVIALLVSTGLLAFSVSQNRKVRQRGAIAVLGALLAAMITVRLHLSVPEGDFRTYTQDAAHFHAYMGFERVDVQAQLATKLVQLFYRGLGSTHDAMAESFRLYAGLGSILYVASGVALGFVEKWSRSVLHYLALAAAAPATLLFFGYREFGYEPLALALLGIPLVITGVQNGGWRLKAGAVVLGLAAALHGFALWTLFTGVLVAVLAPTAESSQPLQNRLRRALDIAAYGIAGYAGWFLIYLFVDKVPVDPGHVTGHLTFRPLVHRFVSEHRYVYPIFGSWQGIRDVLLSLAAGGALLYIPAAIPSSLTRPKAGVIAATVPALLYFILFWPTQGLGNDTDLAVGTFGSFFALAWVVARSQRLTLFGWALFVPAHALFWLTIVVPGMVSGPLPNLPG